MYIKTDIVLNFSGPEGARKARAIARTMIRVYYKNDYKWLPFDDMKKENADGWLHYPERHVRAEKISSLKSLWDLYQMEERPLRLTSTGTTDYPHKEEAENVIGKIRNEGGRFLLCDTDMGQSTLIENRYFEDFFSMFCFILAAKFPYNTFEGICRTVEESYARRILTHAVYDGKVLTFELMEGDPVYSTAVVSWTRADDKFIKSSRTFPSIMVSLVTEDCDGVKRDEELRRWINDVNDVQSEMVSDECRRPAVRRENAENARTEMVSDECRRPAAVRRENTENVRTEMVSAELCFLHASYPHVMLQASSREICVKYRDALLALLKGRGYRTELYSILKEDECRGPNVMVPDGVTIIGDRDFQFRRKTVLRSIVIPGSVTEIRESAFESCTSLKEVIFTGSVMKNGKPESGPNVPPEDNIVFGGVMKNGKPEKGSYLPSEDTIVFGGISGTGGQAAESHASTENRTDSDRAVRIGPRAFAGCTALKTVILPDQLKRVSSGLFCGCTSLENIVIPDSVVEIKKSAFFACESLKSLIIPEKVKRIGEEAFAGCKNLESIVIPEDVMKIGKDAFKDGSPALVLHGRKDSEAERYARENGVIFRECVRGGEKWNSKQQH